MIMTDQQRYDALGCSGNKILKTPSIDRIANEGIRFTNSYTCAVACMPSRASIWSGLHPHQHGVLQTDGVTWLSASIPTIQSIFSEAGYHTVAVGKMHFAPWNTLGGFQQRVIIESKYYNVNDEYRVMLKNLNMDEKRIGHQTPGFGRAFKAIKSPLPEDLYIDGYIGRRGVEVLERIPEPFFLVISFCGPHDPFDPPEPYSEMYPLNIIPPPNSRPEEIYSFPRAIRTTALNMGIEHLDFSKMTSQDIARIQSYYYGMLSLIDKWVGRILNLVDERGFSERTVVLYTSDHGEYLGNHGLLFKFGPGCDDEIRMPLLIRFPEKISSSQVSNAFVQNIDIMPTIFEACGISQSPKYSGKSLFPLIEHKIDPLEFRQYVITHLESRGICYRDHNFKYTRFVDSDSDVLYNLRDDPEELYNLCYFHPGQWQDVISEIQRKMIDWFYQYPACK